MAGDALVNSLVGSILIEVGRVFRVRDHPLQMPILMSENMIETLFSQARAGLLDPSLKSRFRGAFYD